MLSREQALVCVCSVAHPIKFIANRECRGQPARQVRAYRSSRSPGSIDKNRAMANVTILRGTSLIGIVCLRQPPDVVVASGLRISISDRDLVVESLAAIAPHLL